MKSKSKNSKLIILLACVVFAAIVFASAIVSVGRGGGEYVTLGQGTDAPSQNTATSGTQTTEQSSADSSGLSLTTDVPTTLQQIDQNLQTTAALSESGRIIVDPEQELWNLVVVNSGREMPKGYVPQLKEILGCGKYLDYRVAPHYEQMYYAAKEDGVTLTPYSAYRSYERQETNFKNFTDSYMSQYNLSREEAAKKAATVVLPPGTSEHNLGLAMDVCSTSDSFADGEEYAWLQEHAHEYGFILRYTAEKQPITGIVDEPWHWRYVGVEYAEKIKNSGLCLEEYLDSVGIPY